MISLTGKDTIQLDNRILTDFADQDYGTLDFANDLAVVKRGKNGNLIFAENATGSQGVLTLRVLLGSSDDKWLTSRKAKQKADFSSFTVLSGVLGKRVGDGAGVINTKIYQCTGGVFKKMPDTKSNAEGDTDQSVAVHVISFGDVNDSIQ